MADILRRIRTFHEGTLVAADLVESVRFVLDPASGQPVFPTPGHVLEQEDVMLYLPDDAASNPDCLQIHARPDEIDPAREEAADRHAANFGKPGHARWARLHVLSVKRLDEVVDGDLIRLTNPLRRDEGALCRAVNQHPQALHDACARVASIQLTQQPALVGVDPWGADARARFGIIRLEFPQPVSTAQEARAALSALLSVTLS
jgi:hypothetical protein